MADETSETRPAAGKAGAAGSTGRRRGRRREAAREAGAEEFNIGAKIKRLRLERGKTLQDVADETGFSPALISQIENNNVSPPLATLSRIARVLGVTMGYFFRDEGPEVPYEVVRREERPVVSQVISRTGGRHGYIYQALTFHKRDKLMEPFLLHVDATTRQDESQYCHEGQEFLLVLEGETELLLEDERIVLREGDCVYFDSHLRHRLLARGDRPAKVLAVLAKGA